MLLTKSKIYEKRLFVFTFYASDFYIHGNMKKIHHKNLEDKSYLIKLYSYLGNPKYLDLFPKPGFGVTRGIIDNKHLSLIEYYIICKNYGYNVLIGCDTKNKIAKHIYKAQRRLEE